MDTMKVARAAYGVVRGAELRLRGSFPPWDDLLSEARDHWHNWTACVLKHPELKAEDVFPIWVDYMLRCGWVYSGAGGWCQGPREEHQGVTWGDLNAGNRLRATVYRIAVLAYASGWEDGWSAGRLSGAKEERYESRGV